MNYVLSESSARKLRKLFNDTNAVVPEVGQTRYTRPNVSGGVIEPFPFKLRWKQEKTDGGETTYTLQVLDICATYIYLRTRQNTDQEWHFDELNVATDPTYHGWIDVEDVPDSSSSEVWLFVQVSISNNFSIAEFKATCEKPDEEDFINDDSFNTWCIKIGTVNCDTHIVTQQMLKSGIQLYAGNDYFTGGGGGSPKKPESQASKAPGVFDVVKDAGTWKFTNCIIQFGRNFYDIGNKTVAGTGGYAILTITHPTTSTANPTGTITIQAGSPFDIDNRSDLSKTIVPLYLLSDEGVLVDYRAAICIPVYE